MCGQNHSSHGNRWNYDLFYFAEWSGQKNFGSNDYYQLADGTTSDRHTAIRMADVPEIVATAGGDNHTLFIDQNYKVKAIGDNSFGQLGIGNYTNQSSLSRHQIALRFAPPEKTEMAVSREQL